jgi:hypothetical protein
MERIQVRITLPESLRAAIDAARMRWNPEVASNNPAHVTVVYHDEAPDAGLLRSRLEQACRTFSSFTLHLGAVKRFAPPDAGAFIEVSDPDGRVRQLRALALAPPFTPRARFGLHLTLLHPAHGMRLPEAWPSLSGLGRAGAFAVERVDVIAGVGAATETLASFALAARVPREA